MEVKKINNDLRTMAVEHGLCQQWQEEWSGEWDEKRLAERFYAGIDFYLKTRFIPTEYLKGNIGQNFLRANGIIADDAYSLLNPENAIIIGQSTAVIRVNGHQAAHVYALDDAKLKVVAKNRSFVIVHALDRADVDATRYDSARLVVILHSHEAAVFGNAVIREEYNYLK